VLVHLIPLIRCTKGTVFDLVDQAKDFVLSKIDLWVGTRAESTRAPTKYEIPQEVVAEAIVDAPCSREELQDAVGIKDREHFREAYLESLLTVAWIERTIPDKPASRLQKYRLTEKGRRLPEQIDEEEGRT